MFIVAAAVIIIYTRPHICLASNSDRSDLEVNSVEGASDQKHLQQLPVRICKPYCHMPR